MNNFEDYLKNSLNHVNDGIVKEAALYSLMSGGKRIRPELLFSALNAYHINPEKGINAAIGIEMIHTYSLIHDDLPAMDNDDLRRGKPTCHIAYGEDNAILAGDALLSEAFYYANNASDNIYSNAEIVNEFVKNAGLSGMIYGQEIDIVNNNNSNDIETLKKINIYKTGKLITLPLVCAALIADKKGDVDTWKTIGENMGLLFQIQDDILDITSDEVTLGKPIKSDEKNNKVTYATLLGVDSCNELIDNLYNESIALLDTLLIDKDQIIGLFDKIKNRKR